MASKRRRRSKKPRQNQQVLRVGQATSGRNARFVQPPSGNHARSSRSTGSIEPSLPTAGANQPVRRPPNSLTNDELADAGVFYSASPWRR